MIKKFLWFLSKELFLHIIMTNREKFECVNMITRTLFCEGRGENYEGLEAIMTVIYNRCGGKFENVKKVISRKKAFSCWNKMTDNDWNNFVCKFSDGFERDLDKWEFCEGLAYQFFLDFFRPAKMIHNINSYMNKNTADKSNVESWGKDLNIKIGNHWFGYLKENDGFLKTYH